MSDWWNELHNAALALRHAEPVDVAALTPPLPAGVRGAEVREHSQPCGRTRRFRHRLVVDAGAGEVAVDMPPDYRRAGRDERRSMLLAAAEEAARRIAGGNR